MNTYSAILFDLDGTLRFTRPSGIEAYVGFLAEQGVALTPAQVRTGERWAHAYWADTARVSSDLTRYDDKVFWLNYTAEQLEAFGLDDAQLAQEVHQAFDTRYQPKVYLDSAAHQVLGVLRAQGYLLGLVSNRTGELSPLLAELGLEEYFAFTLASGQVNIWKPDPRIFWYACQLGLCNPSDSVYVGDNYYADVLGAQAAGLAAVLYDPRNTFPEAPCARLANLAELLDWLGIPQADRNMAGDENGLSN